MRARARPMPLTATSGTGPTGTGRGRRAAPTSVPGAVVTTTGPLPGPRQMITPGSVTLLPQFAEVRTVPGVPAVVAAGCGSVIGCSLWQVAQ